MTADRSSLLTSARTGVPSRQLLVALFAMTGFSAPGGLDLKAELLKLEGVSVANGKTKPIAD
jgi:hypothetical protein